MKRETGNLEMRQTGLDLLKLCAFLCVVCLHVAVKPWQQLPVNSSQFLVSNFFRGTWGVPVFVMITGSFLLDPDRNVDADKLKKYILRALVAFAVWSAVYEIYMICVVYPINGVTQIQWKWEITELIRGEYHLWYLVMLIGLYMVTPFLRRITREKELMQWYLVLFILWETLTRVVVRLPKVGVLLQPLADNMHFQFAAGYTGYYVLGYYLTTVMLTKRQESFLYIGGVLCLVAAPIGDFLLSATTGERLMQISGTLMPNMILAAVAIFYLFRNRIANTGIVKRISRYIAQLGFGAYLVHALLISILWDILGFVQLVEMPLLWIPVITILISVTSLACAALLRKIPVIGKYIV